MGSRSISPQRNRGPRRATRATPGATSFDDKMEHQEPTEFILDVFTDPRSVRDVVKGILHTIFFHRFFPSLTPSTHDVLDLTLPYVDDDELETMIDQRASALSRQLEAERSSSFASGNAGG